jgi:hypothetical protein
LFLQNTDDAFGNARSGLLGDENPKSWDGTHGIQTASCTCPGMVVGLNELTSTFAILHVA